jgi:hypothetical protein
MDSTVPANMVPVAVDERLFAATEKRRLPDCQPLLLSLVKISLHCALKIHLFDPLYCTGEFRVGSQ